MVMKAIIGDQKDEQNELREKIRDVFKKVEYGQKSNAQKPRSRSAMAA